jgi:DNA replication and repair protein RecF
MVITHLSLTNFRNYGRLELSLQPGVTLFHGANAQGKTNLLEAVFYLATTRSHYAEQDNQLINWVADESDEPIVVGRLVAQIETNEGRQQVELRLIKEQGSFRREALVDHRKVRLMDLLGTLRAVLFVPQDMQIITGPPVDRRRYMDIALCQTDRLYCRHLSSYNKVLEQRNALLRQMMETGSGRDVLPVYTEKLVHLGSQILWRRARFMAGLARFAQRIHYEALTQQNEVLRLGYLPHLEAGAQKSTNGDDEDSPDSLVELSSWLEQAPDVQQVEKRFGDSIAAAMEQDIQRGRTTLGPHRDDWKFWVNGRDLKFFGSRGQQRSAMLALKLAELHWITEQTGEAPIILLDEVMSELDTRRRALLLQTVRTVPQALMTSTDLAMFEPDFLPETVTITIQNGQAHRDQPAT